MKIALVLGVLVSTAMACALPSFASVRQDAAAAPPPPTQSEGDETPADDSLDLDALAASPASAPSASAPPASVSPAAAPTSAPVPASPPRATPAVNLPAPPVARVAPPARTSLMLRLETPADTPFVTVAIYDDAEAFRRGEGAARRLQIQRTGPVTSAWVLGLPPGRYAVTAFQDVDGDGKLGRSVFGSSREPVGYSNGAAAARRGAPSFDAAGFDLSFGGTDQTIRLGGKP